MQTVRPRRRRKYAMMVQTSATQTTHPLGTMQANLLASAPRPVAGEFCTPCSEEGRPTRRRRVVMQFSFASS